RASCDEADDLVTRDRGAALGELGPDVFDALDDDPGVARAHRAGQPTRARRLREVFLRTGLTAHRVHETLDDRLRRVLALADRGVEGRDVAVAHLVGEPEQRLVRGHALDRKVLLAHRLRDRVLAVLDRLLAALLG